MAISFTAPLRSTPPLFSLFRSPPAPAVSSLPPALPPLSLLASSDLLLRRGWRPCVGILPFLPFCFPALPSVFPVSSASSPFASFPVRFCLRLRRFCFSPCVSPLFSSSCLPLFFFFVVLCAGCWSVGGFVVALLGLLIQCISIFRSPLMLQCVVNRLYTPSRCHGRSPRLRYAYTAGRCT